MTRHSFNACAGPAGHWGWCDCADWNYGPEGTREALVDAYNAHVDDALNTGIADPWDEVYDPDDWADALTREEVLGCR